MTHISERCAPVPKKKSTGMSQRQSFLDRGVISENRAILRYNEELEREARQTERGVTGPPDGGRREPGRREGGRRPESGLRTDRARSDDRLRRAARGGSRRAERRRRRRSRRCGRYCRPLPTTRAWPPAATGWS